MGDGENKPSITVLMSALSLFLTGIGAEALKWPRYQLQFPPLFASLYYTSRAKSGTRTWRRVTGACFFHSQSHVALLFIHVA